MDQSNPSVSSSDRYAWLSAEVSPIAVHDREPALDKKASVKGQAFSRCIGKPDAGAFVRLRLEIIVALFSAAIGSGPLRTGWRPSRRRQRRFNLRPKFLSVMCTGESIIWRSI